MLEVSQFLEGDACPPATGGARVEVPDALRQIAHQIRQPLSTIEAIAYYLSITLPKQDAKAHAQLEKVQRLVEDANLILCDALFYFQAAPQRLATVNLNEVICDALSDLVLRERHNLQVNLSAVPISVRIDVAQLTHLIRNLVTYLRHVSSGEREMEIRTIGTPFDAILSVRAMSASCPVEEVVSLLDRGSPHLGSGPGLAMAGVRRLVDANQGRISVEALAGGGVAVNVLLPVSIDTI